LPKKGRLSKSSERIGVFGGTFNPIHSGHLNSALTVRDKLSLSRVLIVPASIPPHREISGPSPQERAAIVAACVRPYQPELELSQIEINRKGISYSFDTLKELGKTFKPENIYFILGADAFKDLPKWKNFPHLLEMCNFAVTTRPGVFLSLAEEDLPQGIAEYVADYKEKALKLNSGREIILVELQDIDASSSEIRKRLRSGHDVSKWLPKNVIELIREKGFYKRSSPLVADYREFAKFCSHRALDKKALDLKIYDMTKGNAYAEYSVICSATSHRHASSLGEGIVESVKEEFGLAPINVEGLRNGHWVLIDFGSVVVHVFQDAIRAQYKIEGLWQGYPQFQGELVEKARVASKKTKSKEEARGSRP